MNLLCVCPAPAHSSGRSNLPLLEKDPSLPYPTMWGHGSFHDLTFLTTLGWTGIKIDPDGQSVSTFPKSFELFFNVLISLGYITRSGIARSYDNSTFSILWDHQTLFQSSSTILHFHQQCNDASNFSTPSPTLALFYFSHPSRSEVVVPYCGFVFF